MSNPRDKYEIVDADASLIVSFADAPLDNEPPSPGALETANLKADAAGFIVDGTGTFQYFNEFNELVTPPILPSGHIIDSKNTLQSFASDPLTMNTSLEHTKRSATITDTFGRNTQSSNETTRTNSDTLCIAEAIVVDPTIEPAPDSTAKPNRNAQTKVSIGYFLSQPCNAPVWMVLTFICVLIIAVVTGVVVSQKNDSGNNASTKTPTVDVMLQNELKLTEFINNSTLLSDKNIAVNGITPESKALDWILNKDDLWNDTSFLTLSSEIESNVSVRVLQRYALAVLWFQQIDGQGFFKKKWTTVVNWLQDPDECTWFGIDCTEGIVTKIDFFNGQDEHNNFDDVYNIFDDDHSDDNSVSTEDANNIGSSIPEELGLLNSIQHFDLAGNMLTGTLPESIGRWTALTYICLNSNELTGSLPDSMGQWASLGYIDVSHNMLFESLPQAIGNWTALTHFSAAGNDLSGTLPDAIGQWSILNYFDMSGNKFSGTLPESIVNWNEVKYFDLNSNYVGGTLPMLLGQWTSLTFFNVDNNRLSGTLPVSIGQWTDLTSFRAISNEFSGSIPSSIGNWTAISAVRLKNNSLTGSLPVSLGNWTAVSLVSLDDNSLTGALPTSLGQWNDIYYFSIDNNELSGTIPLSLGNWRKVIQFFYVNSNMLFGSIPSFLGNWSVLYQANFSDNNFTGFVPPEICSDQSPDFFDFTVDCALTVNCTCCTDDVC
jgi:hypothetical protein